MADEDEIDILGDTSLDNFLTKNDNIYDNTPLVSQNAELTELLNCEYTIHPQWMLDKPSANPACWYNNSESSSDNIEQNIQISTENTISDESGWTEKEKNLLQRGIDIFGKSNVCLSQFIGSKTPAEVKYYLRHFYSDLETTHGTFNNEFVLNSERDHFSINDESEVLSENDIPASIEEVISAVSTAEPTVQTVKRKKQKYAFHTDKRMSIKTSVSKTVNRKAINNNRMGKINGTVKFRTKLNVAKDVQKKVKHKKIVVEPEKNTVQIITGKGLAVPVCAGEQVIRLDKTSADSESDIEVDIEHTDLPQKVLVKNPSPLLPTNNKSSEVNKEDFENDNQIDLSTINEMVRNELTTLEVPTCEVVLDKHEVSELEKVVHHEFFKGRTTKTPQRYLKIRNHIINTWISSKPTYITKTSVRSGLKNCGDVKLIGRIHYYLEQIGAINFGCSQTNYNRPLIEMLQISRVTNEKSKETPKISTAPLEVLMRKRCKKKFVNDGEGGCTLMHDEKGDVINTMVVNEEPPKQRIYKKRPIRLIYCRTFNEEHPQKYDVSLHLSALLLMDLHAHMSLTEVMGLVGGHWNESNKHLTITHFEPCRNIASTLTHCDMCPVSQAKAADAIHSKGLSILGWFHSHPMFEPEPSQQDLDTQFYLQQWIGTDKPCIGIILTPFSSQRTLTASPYRCMIVDKKTNFQDQYLPFKLTVDLISNELNIKEFLNNAKRLLKFDSNVSAESRVDFKQMYFQDRSITYLDKFISSIKMHLLKCKDINKNTCDKVTQELKRLFHDN